MMRIREAVVVEGRYDQSKLAQLVDAVIVTTEGFGVFHDAEKLAYLRRLARERGLIILTDGDGAGFLIRGRLSACIPPEQLKHAYIPDVFGKERRKAVPSKEGKLGVEGMDSETLRQALLRAGATVLDGAEDEKNSPGPRNDPLTKADLYAWGLSGRGDSRQRRLALQRRLGLPERLSPNGLLRALNALYSREELFTLMTAADPADDGPPPE